jgi:hypothetical protein
VTVVLPPALAYARPTKPGIAAGQPDAGENEARRRTLLQASVGNRGVLSAPLLDVIDAIRRQGEQVFEETALTVASLERLEENSVPHGAAHLTGAPVTVLCDIAADYMEVRDGLAGRLPADLRQRLCRIAAQLTGLVGLVLADVARFSQARTWFHLSNQAADEHGDKELRAWARAIEAFEPFFLADYPRAIAFARQAQALSRNVACPGSVLGYLMESRALARTGHNSEALAALRHADEGFERLDPEVAGNSWLGYPQAAYLCHRADALARLGLTTMAQRAVGAAAGAYSPTAVRGRAYVEFCRATCDIGDGQVADGCERTVTTLLDVPVEQRVALVKARARDVLDAVPPEARNTRATRDLKDALREM